MSARSSPALLRRSWWRWFRKLERSSSRTVGSMPRPCAAPLFARARAVRLLGWSRGDMVPHALDEGSKMPRLFLSLHRARGVLDEDGARRAVDRDRDRLEIDRAGGRGSGDGGGRPVRW